MSLLQAQRDAVNDNVKLVAMIATAMLNKWSYCHYMTLGRLKAGAVAAAVAFAFAYICLRYCK